MSGRRAAAAVLVIVMVLPSVASFSGAATFGSLTVTASDWQLIVPPSHAAGGGNFSHDLFQAAGDLDGNGFDDLVIWPLGTMEGSVVLPGGPAGLDYPLNYSDLAFSCPNPIGGIDWNHFGCREVTDAGFSPALDGRPSGVALAASGLAALLYDTHAVGYCQLGPGCADQRVVATNVTGGASAPIRLGLTPATGPGSEGYLTPPVRAGDGAAIVNAISSGRAGNGTEPALTSFEVYFISNLTLAAAPLSWQAQEPEPLGPFPRPPHFVGAPDFDGDGFADIVTWSPPAPGANAVYPGVLTIYNGSANGPTIERPFQLHAVAPEVLLADFDGDGHIDVATYRLEGGPPGTGTAPHLHVEFRFWHPDGFHGLVTDAIDLAGPSIFLTQPPARLRAGDIDGDGAADLATLKYDTTSASAGHVLVDVFSGGLVCRLCDRLNTWFEPDFSTEIQLGGPDIYANDDGLRLNLQGDFDGDGRRDITVGYYGGNAPDRGRTSSSGFVAVLYGSTVVHSIEGIWIDTEPGQVVLPDYRNYTIHVERETLRTAGDGTALRVNITGLATEVYIDVNLTGAVAVSSAPDLVAIDGPGSVAGFAEPFTTRWNIQIPVKFNWSEPAPRNLSLVGAFLWDNAGELFYNLRAARFDPRVEPRGSIVAESDGRFLASGGWSRAGAPINFSGLNLAYAALPSALVAGNHYSWTLRDGAGALLQNAAGGPLSLSVGTPSSTTRGLVYSFGIAGAASPSLVSPLNFTISVDGDVPQFGDHLPLESEWVTSSPAMVAVEIFDNESGVDPSRIEVSWENDGAPFVRWERATALPGETAAQVVGRAFINFPEGNLSNLIWRVWDNVGNGPVESPIFGIKVDTQDITFHDPWPAAAEWQNETSVGAGVWLRTGPSGLKNGSLEYRVSTSGIFGFGAWQAQCPPPPPPPPGPGAEGGCLVRYRTNPDGSIDMTWGRGYSVKVELVDGDNNWIQWRAENDAGSGSRISDPYQIRVDSRPLVISAISPNETTLFPLGPVSLVVSAHEGSPEGVAQRGIDTTMGHSTFRIRGPGQLEFGPPQSFSQIIVGPTGWSAEFRANLTLERGNSTVEVSLREIDGRTTTAETIVRINQLPSITVVSDPANSTVLINGTILLTATGTDPDGHELRFSWGPCPQPTPREPARQPEFSRNASLTLSTTSPEPLRTTSLGTISLCVVAFDGLDGASRLEVNVSVVESLPEPPPPPPPPSVSVLSPEADAFFLLVLLLAAAGAAAALVVLRRRRLPPDNL